MSIRNTLWHGDCLEVNRILDNESIDLIATDPPYLVDYQSNHRKDKFDKIKNDTNPEFIQNYLLGCYDLLKYNAGIYVFCDYKTIDFFKPLFESLFQLKNLLIWKKNNWTGGDLDGAYAHQYEMILFGHKGRSLLRGKRFPDVLEYDRVVSSEHPTEKPIDLLKFLITNSSDVGDLVYDGCMGLGSTCVAAKQTGRDYIGIEIKKDYYDIALRRVTNTAQQLELELV